MIPTLAKFNTVIKLRITIICISFVWVSSNVFSKVYIFENSMGLNAPSYLLTNKQLQYGYRIFIIIMRGKYITDIM